MTIEHNLSGISGSITKLQIIKQSQLLAISNITAQRTVAFNHISISGTWEEVEITPDAGYKLTATDTDNGPMQNINIEGVLMNDGPELFNYLYDRYIALVTDGEGKRFLFGNLAEYLKLEIDTDSNKSRSDLKTTQLIFKGVTVMPTLVVL